MSGYRTSTSLSQVDRLSTNPRVLGRHIRSIMASQVSSHKEKCVSY